jgi:hypothetical protein
MKILPKLTAVLVLSLAQPVLVSGVAYAQNASTMADARFHEGMAFVQAGQYEQARLAFQQAYAISKDPTTLWNLALAEMKTNRPVDAIRHFRAFKRDPKANTTDLPTCDSLIQRLEAQTCRVNVTTATGAEIKVDGERWADNAPTPGPIDVGDGAHTITVSLGSKSESRDVTATKGQEINITINIDDTVVVLPPPHRDEHPIEPPKTEEKSVAFPPPTGAIILGGVGIIGLGLGVGFALDSTSKRSTFDSQNCATVGTTSCTDLRSSGTTASTISYVGYIGGGALLAGGLVWWIVAPRTKMQTVGLTPMLSPGLAGLSLHKSF